MSWRISTRHVSTYRYGETVVASYNEARISPASGTHQRVIDSSVAVAPSSSLYRYEDYFGTLVVAFDVTEPHSELTVIGSSVVETESAPVAPAMASWAELRDETVLDRFAEYLGPTRATFGNDETTEIASAFSRAPSPYDAVESIVEWIGTSMRYEKGSTEVSTSALEAFESRSGVCQDFAHLGLVLLRTIGIPARYVSGYLHPEEDPLIGVASAGASHAWFECWLGEWRGFDPTNGLATGERHVTIGHGRDYGDVAPFRGVYHGGALDSLTVAVDLTRVA